ncbi:hypothetical protein BHE74_00017593 [Ensete ventricosum]|nr:hypothetical protein BHE74_00017593 [Ensete ventricosum]RZS10900.1 hypothetical protein BHM03_00042174 [Ensete ventricosum]
MQHANAVRTDGDATSPGMRSASRCGKKKKKKKTADEAKAIAITHMNALSWWSALPALPNKIVPKMLAAMSISLGSVQVLSWRMNSTYHRLLLAQRMDSHESKSLGFLFFITDGRAVVSAGHMDVDGDVNHQ